MPKRDFLQISDVSRSEAAELFELAGSMKSGRYRDRPLSGKSLAMVFAKSSTRTRVSFEVGSHRLGGHPIFLSSQDMQLGRGESISDTALVLSRYVDGIMIRTFAHSDVVELAHHASIPVLNGLTDLLHPCQVLSDVFTVADEFGGCEDRVIAWIGDGNNMANSWLNAAALFGFELRLACPEGYEPDHEIFNRAKQQTTVNIFEDPDEAVRGAHVVNTDVWASMGQEADAAARRLAFKGYTVDSALMQLAADDVIFLHCLPAHRGEEVEEAVIDGPQSRVFDQAENRLYVQMALLAMLMG